LLDCLFGKLNPLKGTKDANKILSNDAACPICDQVLSKSLMKPVDVYPNDEWINVSDTPSGVPYH
ncbi:hypothetical protein RJ641_034290, partial [Dillenia turbinata]